MAYTHLGDDLAKLIDGYTENPLISENQRKIWSPRGKQKAITRGMLGNSHSRALRLLKADGHDDQPVGSLSPRSAESFWNYGDNHVFAPTDDLIRLAIFMRLDLYRALALVLKGHWEEFYAREICGWTANVGKNLGALFHDEGRMQEAMSRFNPSTDTLFARLLVHAHTPPRMDSRGKPGQASDGLKDLKTLTAELTERMTRSGVRWLSEAGYSSGSFDTLVQTMLLNKLHWVATDSPELAYFRTKAMEEAAICSHGTDEERRAYWSLTNARVQLLMSLDDMYLQIEGVRVQNETIQMKYMSVFGKHEIALLEARGRYLILEQKVLLKQADPKLTEEDLDAAAEAKIKEMEEDLRRLKDEAVHAPLLDRDPIWGGAGGGGVPLSKDEICRYREEAKTIIRTIKLLTHPDRLKNDPVYAQLTPEQKEELRMALESVMRIGPVETLFPPGSIELKYRSLAVLKETLKKVRHTLETAGINVDVELVIRGDTLPERLAWLEQDIARIEADLDMARVELQALLTSEDLQLKQGILANTAKHEEIKAEMQKQTEEINHLADELEAELQSLMGGDGQ